MMKKLVILTTLIGVIALASGCLSYNTLEGSKQRVGIRKAIVANNERAIMAIKNGDSPQAAGINVTTWEALSERPVLQTGAAIGDSLIIWGGVEGVQWLADQSGSSDDEDKSTSSTAENNNGNTTIINNNGDGNTTTVDNSGIPDTSGIVPQTGPIQ
jgi:hypothetical protein